MNATLNNWMWDRELTKGMTGREARQYAHLTKVRVEVDGVWMQCELVSLKIPRTLKSIGINKGWHLALVLPHSKTLIPANDWHAYETEEESMVDAMRLWALRPKAVMMRDYRITWPANMAVAIRGGAR